MAKSAPRPLRVIFFCTETGNEPVREWLLKLTTDDRKSIGADILAVQWANPWSIHWAVDFGKCDLPFEIGSPGSFSSS